VQTELYKDLLAQIHRRMLQELRGLTFMHICGPITPRLDALTNIGLT